MPAYLIARVNITNPARYADYMKVTPAAIARHGGKFIVRGGETITLEGPPETSRVVVIEFPDLPAARAFYNSPEYQAAKKLREGAATGQFIAIAGATVAPG